MIKFRYDLNLPLEQLPDGALFLGALLLLGRLRGFPRARQIFHTVIVLAWRLQSALGASSGLDQRPLHV
jgi:hypothetical protein